MRCGFAPAVDIAYRFLLVIGKRGIKANVVEDTATDLSATGVDVFGDRPGLFL